MIIGIVGSRRRNSLDDEAKLTRTIIQILRDNRVKGCNVKIVTGDCNKGGDDFARDLCELRDWECDVKRIKDPETGEEMDFNNHRWFPYKTMCQIFYDRDEEIAKEPLDYLVCLVACDRKGGTEKTIEYFKIHHEDWKKKLVLI